MKIFFDGGCRGDPPVMEIAVVIGGEAIACTDLGSGTSSEAEWRALLHAARIAQRRGLADVVLIGDSAEVIAKASGRMPPRRAAAYLNEFRTVTATLPRVRLRQVKRAQNLAGIALARRHPR